MASVSPSAVVDADDPATPTRRLNGALSVGEGLGHGLIVRADCRAYGAGLNDSGQLAIDRAPLPTLT